MLGDGLGFFLHKESNLKGVSSPGWALGEALRVLRIGFGGAVIGLVVLAVGAAVGLAGVMSYARQSRRVVLLLALPAFTTLLGALAARGTMYPRFFFLLAGFALLIGMRGAFVAGGWLARRLGKGEATGFGLATAMAALVVLASAASIPLDWRAPKQDYEGAMRFVEGVRRDGDLIATTDVTAEIYGAYYRKPWQPVSTAEELSALRSRRPAGSSVWLLYTFPRYLERTGDG
jgi:hypothetical protein